MFDIQNLPGSVSASFAALDVPAFDKASVHERVARQRAACVNVQPHRHRRRALAIGLIFLSPVMALAFSSREALVTALKERLHAEGVKVPIHYYETRKTSLAEMKARAPFRVTLPSGLPNGYALKGIVQARPGVYALTYFAGTAGLTVELHKNDPRDYYTLGRVQFVIDAQGRITKETRVRTRAWIVGNEVLLLSSAHLSDAQFEAIKRATGARDEPAAPVRRHR